jgi:hypothetical protein
MGLRDGVCAASLWMCRDDLPVADDEDGEQHRDRDRDRERVVNRSQPCSHKDEQNRLGPICDRAQSIE